MEVDDAFGIIGNHAFGESLPIGCQCWMMFLNRGNGYDRNQMMCRQRGGRWIQKWIAADRITDWRVKFIPPTIRDRGVFSFPTRRAAEEYLGELIYDRLIVERQITPTPPDRKDENHEPNTR